MTAPTSPLMVWTCSCGEWSTDVHAARLADDHNALEAVTAHKSGCWIALTEPFEGDLEAAATAPP